MKKPNHSDSWVQQALVDGGYSQLMVEITCHVSGQTDEVYCGVSLEDPVTRETVAITTKGIVGTLADKQDLALAIVDLLEVVQRKLEPFG